MNQPMARVVKLEYRDMQPKMAADTSAFIVHFRAPDGEMYEHPLQNDEWLIHNSALQFMALNNFRPSDIDGTSSPSEEGDFDSEPIGSETSMNVEQWGWLIPVAPDGDDYLLAANVLEGGVTALENAEWFGADDESKPADDAHSGNGGGGGGGGGGSAAKDVAADDEGGVEAELTPEEDTGVEVTIS